MLAGLRDSEILVKNLLSHISRVQKALLFLQSDHRQSSLCHLNVELHTVLRNKVQNEPWPYWRAVTRYVRNELLTHAVSKLLTSDLQR